MRRIALSLPDFIFIGSFRPVKPMRVHRREHKENGRRLRDSPLGAPPHSMVNWFERAL
jgi:hypothetical protein